MRILIVGHEYNSSIVRSITENMKHLDSLIIADNKPKDDTYLIKPRIKIVDLDSPYYHTKKVDMSVEREKIMKNISKFRKRRK